MDKFSISSTEAILPVTLYTIALGFGPIVGGPLLETVGRLPVYAGALILGALFTLGAGLANQFSALCVLRFLAGFCWAPVLAVAPGSLAETFEPRVRGFVFALCILMPFLGPGLGPVIGAFATTGKNWRWTQWSLLFFAIWSLLWKPLTQETFHPAIKARLAKKRGQRIPQRTPVLARLRVFVVVAVIRPLRMLLFEPIVTFICLFAAVEFGTLFSFFAGVPYTFATVYGFSIDDAGLLFLAIVIGCLLGLLTIVLCDLFSIASRRRDMPQTGYLPSTGSNANAKNPNRLAAQWTPSF